jgi:S-DNA-T family DNA segregation ATPase FtsK/SpoIIIE
MSTTDSFILVFLILAVTVLVILVIRKKKNLPTAISDTVLERERIAEQTTWPEPEADAPIELPDHKPNEILSEEDPHPPIINIYRPSPELDIEKSEDDKARSLVSQFGIYNHKLDLASYSYPSLDLLDTPQSTLNITADDLDTLKNRLVAILNSYQIRLEKIKVNIGPTVMLYEITPVPGIRIAQIQRLENDIALNLAAAGTRVIGHLPGKDAIGIEVPHRNPDLVYMRGVLSSPEFQNTMMDLPIILGRTMTDQVFITDLAKMPHLLIAGATGQGKSVGIHAILLSLLYKKHPAELKLILIDMNKLELTLFRKIERHFLAKLPDESDAIITNLSQVSNTLHSLSMEMDQRYDLLREAQVRNLKEYNEKFVSRKLSDPERHRYLQYIVVVIDEFTDLISKTDQSIEMLIARIAQLGRPAGIHLIISTQRPSVNIITGSIKANFSGRLAYRLSSINDSRTILDNGGAEQLNGQGDMLFSNGTELIHLQGAFVHSEEIERLCAFIGEQRGYPTAMLLPEYGIEAFTSKSYDPDDLDPMFEEAARLVVIHQQGSASLIQRKMKLGYNRAGRIMDQLEALGIVGPFEGSKARDVRYPDEYSLEQYLEKLQR